MVSGYGIDPAQAVAVLNAALATEMVCVMRYRHHHFVARGINAEPIAAEFLVHSNEELAHADLLAKRIVQLGGSPELDPAGFSARSHAEYVTAPTLREMIRENLIAERIAVEAIARWCVSSVTRIPPRARCSKAFSRWRRPRRRAGGSARGGLILERAVRRVRSHRACSEFARDGRSTAERWR